MKLSITLVLFLVLVFAAPSCANKHYRLYGSYLALLRVEYDTFIDNRDGYSYKVYKVEKHFNSRRCSGTEYCIDTAFVYMFAENIRYVTPRSECHSDGCEKYGRYYPKEELGLVCPTGWSIPTAEDANVVDYILFDGDTIYGISDRYIRLIHVKDFPSDGSKITDRYGQIEDFPSGWLDFKTKKFRCPGKIGTMWTKKESDYYPAYIDFNLINFDEMNNLIQNGDMEAPGNMYPAKCHKVVFKKNVSENDIVPRSLDFGIYSMDEF